jgi:hypothetical protein
MLQRLKGQGLDLRWVCFDVESGLGEEPVDVGGPVLDLVEPVLHDRGQLAHGAAGAEIAQAVLHVRPGLFASRYAIMVEWTGKLKLFGWPKSCWLTSNWAD